MNGKNDDVRPIWMSFDGRDDESFVITIAPDARVFEQSMLRLAQAERERIVTDVRSAVACAGRVEMGRRWSRRLPGISGWQLDWFDRMFLRSTAVPPVFLRLSGRGSK